MSKLSDGGTQRCLTETERMVDMMLAHRRILGDRVWGMLHLYYRAGLTMEEVADVFETKRQMVSYELRRAARIVAQTLAGAKRRRRCTRQLK